MKKAIAAGIGLLAVGLAYAAKDPVIMIINGESVPKSEFEYLYNKNSQQQINPQTLEEYLEMFKLYKMKVAEAKAEGLDTLASFRKEMEQYKRDLAAPYITDSIFINQLIDESYERSKREVEAYHIMFFKTRSPKLNKELRQRADSLKRVLDNGGDFASLAAQYSQDRGSSGRGGYMGYITAGKYPYSFEVADFALPEGKISDVVESPVGYHILKGGKSRPARGQVRVSHILKMARDAESRPEALRRIDSIYNVVKSNPDKFRELASTMSDDPGSARQGGALPWFGSGEMVAEFDSVAFAMPVGEISKPFATSYGYHIIYKHEERPGMDLAQHKKMMLPRITSPQDERFKLIQKHQTERFAARHGARLDDKTVSMLRSDIAAGGLDSAFYAKWTSAPRGNMTLLQADGIKYPVSEFVKKFNNALQSDPDMAIMILDGNLDSYMNTTLTELEEDALADREPDYRNLLKEYVDGSLLYEVSLRKVWDKAAKDSEGLERYFKSHKADYKWDAPHVKGLFVQAANDSVAGAVKERIASLNGEDAVQTIRKEFKGQAAIESILIAKGGNPMVDHVAFGGPAAESSIKAYPVYFMLNQRILTEPEEYGDVKGAVTSDYQNEMQEEWEKELRRKYPVKVNEKVLNNVSKK